MLLIQLLFFLYSLATVLVAGQDSITYICDNSVADTSTITIVYALRPGSRYCYRYFDTTQTFRAAERTCENDQATLLRISSKEENDYINSTYSSKPEFWIGLSDVANEGSFVWSDGESLNTTAFQVWVDGAITEHNTDAFDCVKFTSQGWIVHQGLCGDSDLPFVCKQAACSSSDGRTCISPLVQSSSLGPVVISLIVLLPIAILAIAIGIVVFLLVIMWKRKKDRSSKYYFNGRFEEQVNDTNHVEET